MSQENFTACSAEKLEHIKDILSHFEGEIGGIKNIEILNNGRINESILVTRNTPNGFDKVVLQRINQEIFKNPIAVMENAGSVTTFIREHGGQTLTFYKVKRFSCDSPYIYYDKGRDEYWRMYAFVEAKVKNSVSSAKDMEYVGEAIAKLSISLRYFKSSKLVETIKNFHNTDARLDYFARICMKDIFNTKEVDGKVIHRIDTCRKEVAFIMEREQFANIIVDALEKEEIPMRVSHNDTKINNILFDEHTGMVICWIDLDTLMPGSLLFDTGDACRYGCNMASEEESDVSKVSFNLEYFEAFVRGLLTAMKDVITEKERKMLPLSVWMITYEQDIRFLGDHINGNTYFKVPYDGKNLERARVQMELLKDIERKYDQMQAIVESVWEEVSK